jgi:hypothetical protein
VKRSGSRPATPGNYRLPTRCRAQYRPIAELRATYARTKHLSRWHAAVGARRGF